MHGWLLCVYLFLQVHPEWILKKWMTADCDLWEVDCCWDGCVGMLSDPQLQRMVLLKTASCHSNQPLCQGWMVFFSLGGHLHMSLKLFLTPSHVRSEVHLCCRDYLCWQRRYQPCNMYTHGMVAKNFTINWAWFWMACSGRTPIDLYTIRKLVKRRIRSIYRKFRCEGCGKSYMRSTKISENRYFLLQKGVRQYYN